jgi:glutamine amidotransferase
MQMMGRQSEEGICEGLGWIDANVVKFDEKIINQRSKLPHMGWNNVVPKSNHPLFNGIDEHSIFYFLHSYYMQCKNQDNVLAFSEYYKTFNSAVGRDSIYGVQFHPEKSHDYGQKLLFNFAQL